MNISDQKVKELKKENDENITSEINFEKERKPGKVPYSDASRKLEEDGLSHNGDSELEQQGETYLDLERERNTKEHPHAVAASAKPKEGETSFDSKPKKNEKKSLHANSKNKQQEITSGHKAKFNEGYSGNENQRRPSTFDPNGPGVKWKNTAEAEKKLRETEKAAEFERRMRGRTILDATKRFKEILPELEQSNYEKSSSVSDTHSKEQQTIRESSQAYDTLPNDQETARETETSLKSSDNMFQKQEETFESKKISKDPRELHQKAEEINRILSSHREREKLETSPYWDQELNATETDWQTDQQNEFSSATTYKIIPNVEEKHIDGHRLQPIEEFPSKSGEKFQQQTPTSGMKAAHESTSEALKASESSHSGEEMKSRGDNQTNHFDHTPVKGTSESFPIDIKSSTVALASIEEELLERTDPDLEEAIFRSIAFSFRITEPLVTADALAAVETQKLKEEEEVTEAERILVCRASAISVALSADSSDTTKDEVQKQGVMGRLLRPVDDALSASVKSKHCRQIFRSAFAIRKEKKRQRQINRFVIHPYSEFRIGWDIMVVIALVLTMLALPIEIAFYSVEEERHGEETEHVGDTSHVVGTSATAQTEHNETVALDGYVQYGQIYESINLFAESIFILDIILNFRTGYVFRETDQVILSSKKIVWHYLRTWFIFDFISAVPFDKIYEAFAGHNKDQTQYLQIRFIRLAKILALLRAFQVFRLLRYIRTLETIFVLQENVVQICNLIGATLLFAHWNGCLQYMACFTEHYPNFPPNSWIYLDQLQWSNVTVLRRYTRSMLRALSHMLAVGYAENPPTSTTETWVVLVSMIVGCTFYALFIAYMAALLRSLDYSGAKYSEEVDSLQEFMRFHKIPSRVQRRILRFFDQKFRHKFFDSDVYFKTSILSPIFQEILSMHNCRHLVESISFFKNASREFIYAIVSRLEFQVFFPGEFILHAGSKSQSLLLIAHGKVEVSSNNVLLEKIYDGGHFGEVSLILNEPQQFDVIAADVSDIFLLTKTKFDEVLAEFSEIRDSLRTIAEIRLQRQSTRIQRLKHKEE